MKKYALVWFLLQGLHMNAQIFPLRSDQQLLDQIELLTGNLFNTHNAIIPASPLQTAEQAGQARTAPEAPDVQLTQSHAGSILSAGRRDLAG